MGKKNDLKFSEKPYFAIILPNKIEGKKFKPIPIEYIGGDNKEEICIINENLKIDSTGISCREVVDDFVKKFLTNWRSFKNNQIAKNYLYMNTPDIHPEEYENLKNKYLEFEDNFKNK